MIVSLEFNKSLTNDCSLSVESTLLYTLDKAQDRESSFASIGTDI